jgi:hypothetical protein
MLPWQQCRYLINLLATLESYRLTAQMNKRFILVQTLKVTLPGLLQRLSDNVLYVGVCVNTKPMKSIPERVCHVHHYRRSSRECTGLLQRGFGPWASEAAENLAPGCDFCGLWCE